jgi:DNA-binding FrmR family transcriptional regulator
MAVPRTSKSYATDKESLIARLSKIEGQARGIRRMVEEDRYCVDVLQQIASLRSAADAVAQIILGGSHPRLVSFTASAADGDAHISEVMEVIRRYVRS